ncbi:LytR/AlgR family response regulator transcription factor [Psychroserpens mesophilus]|uniref:LytR/AlgR family response regulator transcription factor n=1 Tax=Psychroserpens mesophilus TaxID=325473 RepID=UPI003D64728D
MFLKQNNIHIQVDVDTILFIEASGNYTKVVTSNNTISIREKISDIIQLLSDNDFLQVHKSFAVAKKQIVRVEGNRIYIGDHIVPIGKLYKTNINQLIK